MVAGLDLCDPFGKQRFVIPHLFSYVGDEPELKDIFCIKGHGSKHPCELCMVDSHRLNDVEAAFPVRLQCDQVSAHHGLEMLSERHVSSMQSISNTSA